MITYQKWKRKFEDSLLPDQRINDDLYLLHKSGTINYGGGPFRADMSIVFIVKQGYMKVKIDMVQYMVEPSSLMLIVPGQVFQVTEVSETIDIITIMMSEAFTNSFFNEYSAFNQLYKSIMQKPLIPLSEELEKGFDVYVTLLDNLLKLGVKTYQLDAAKHLTLSMFYGIVLTMHELDSIKPTDRPTLIFKEFQNLLQRHYRKEREVSFYADKLCISPKYLSAIVLQQTGKSAIRCINEYVLNECQALLLSSHMSLQEIAYKLNFPSQSVFSKFFKRMTDVSPREYRKQTD